MATLTSLKLSAAQKNSSLTAAQVRRTKMLKAIGEQIAIAKAVQAGALNSPGF